MHSSPSFQGVTAHEGSGERTNEEPVELEDQLKLGNVHDLTKSPDSEAKHQESRGFQNRKLESATGTTLLLMCQKRPLLMINFQHAASMSEQRSQVVERHVSG